MDFLLKRPKKWTSAHLQAVNPREYDEVAASAIVPEASLAANQDNCSTDVVPVKTLNLTNSTEWRELADQLASVPQSEIPVYIFADEKHTFDQTLSTLFNAVRCYDGHISRCELGWLLDEFLQLTMIHHLQVFAVSNLPQHIADTSKSLAARNPLPSGDPECQRPT